MSFAYSNIKIILYHLYFFSDFLKIFYDYRKVLYLNFPTCASSVCHFFLLQVLIQRMCNILTITIHSIKNNNYDTAIFSKLFFNLFFFLQLKNIKYWISLSINMNDQKNAILFYDHAWHNNFWVWHKCLYVQWIYNCFQ